MINSYYDYDSTYNVIEYWLQMCIISSNNLQAKSKNQSLFWSRILLWLGNEKLYFPTWINVLMLVYSHTTMVSYDNTDLNGIFFIKYGLFAGFL